MKLALVVVAAVAVNAILGAAAPCANAGYDITVCGTWAGRGEKYSGQSRNAAEARRRVTERCEETERARCLEPICRRVFQPTRVDELPPATQRQLRAELAESRRAARGVARRNDPYEYAWSEALADAKRKGQEEQERKLLEFARECESMQGCPKRF